MTCDHSESLYGRCVSCGKTWDQQAEARSGKPRITDDLAFEALRAFDAARAQRGLSKFEAMRAALEAALPHLEGATPVAHDQLAAEVEPWLQECGSCDAGLSMACTCPKGDYRSILLKVWRAYEAGEGATPATGHRPTCGTTYGESCDGYCPTPAIDREALTELLRFNRSAPHISNERLADMVIALIGTPNSGASEDDQVTR